MVKRLVPLSVGVLTVILGSAAWACAPGGHVPSIDSPPGDRQTRFSGCTPPEGATKPCKPILDTPAFPYATVIKGPAGSTVFAYVSGGLDPGQTYMLRFLSKPQLDAGISCSHEPSSVIGGPTLSNMNGGLATTKGTIPSAAALGGGQVCFGHLGTAQESLPAKFKVVV